MTPSTPPSWRWLSADMGRRPPAELLPGAVGPGGLPADRPVSCSSRWEGSPTRADRWPSTCWARLSSRSARCVAGPGHQRAHDDRGPLHPGSRGSVHVLHRQRDHHRGLPALAKGQGSGSERDRRVRGAHSRPGHRRADRRSRQLAVDLLHQRPHRRRHRAGRLGAAARGRPGSPRVARRGRRASTGRERACWAPRWWPCSSR